MYTVETKDLDAFEVLVNTLEKYNKAKDLVYKSKVSLENKKLKMGDYVTIDNPEAVNYIPNEIGRIVGWDFKHNFYRVCFGEDRAYMGVKEEFLTPCSVQPESLENVDYLDITFKHLMK